MRLLVYTALRLALFAGTFLVLWAILRSHLSPWILALFALLISSIASFVLLRGQAERAGQDVAGGWKAARKRLDEAKRREDEGDFDAEEDPTSRENATSPDESRSVDEAPSRRDEGGGPDARRP